MSAERTVCLLNGLNGRQESGHGVLIQTLRQQIRKHVCHANQDAVHQQDGSPDDGFSFPDHGSNLSILNIIYFLLISLTMNLDIL
jgi:hypothetical protein